MKKIILSILFVVSSLICSTSFAACNEAGEVTYVGVSGDAFMAIIDGTVCSTVASSPADLAAAISILSDAQSTNLNAYVNISTNGDIEAVISDSY